MAVGRQFDGNQGSVVRCGSAELDALFKKQVYQCSQLPARAFPSRSDRTVGARENLDVHPPNKFMWNTAEPNAERCAAEGSSARGCYMVSWAARSWMAVKPGSRRVWRDEVRQGLAEAGAR